MRLAAATAALLLAPAALAEQTEPAPAPGKFYRYIDASGTPTFVNDPKAIPKDRRHTAQPFDLGKAAARVPDAASAVAPRPSSQEERPDTVRIPLDYQNAELAKVAKVARSNPMPLIGGALAGVGLLLMVLLWPRPTNPSTRLVRMIVRTVLFMCVASAGMFFASQLYLNQTLSPDTPFELKSPKQLVDDVRGRLQQSETQTQKRVEELEKIDKPGKVPRKGWPR